METRYEVIFFFSSRRRHTRCRRDWSSDVCSSDLNARWTVLGVGYATRGITANVLWRIDTRAILPANRATKGCLWRIDTRAILPANRATKEIGRASCRERV